MESEARLEQAVRIYAKGPMHGLCGPRYRKLGSASSGRRVVPRVNLALAGGYTETRKVPRRPSSEKKKGKVESFMEAMDAKLEKTLQEVHDQLRASDDERRKQLERIYKEEMKDMVSPGMVAKLKLLLEDAQALVRQQQATADQAAVTIGEQQRRLDDARLVIEEQKIKRTKKKAKEEAKENIIDEKTQERILCLESEVSALQEEVKRKDLEVSNMKGLLEEEKLNVSALQEEVKRKDLELSNMKGLHEGEKLNVSALQEEVKCKIEELDTMKTLLDEKDGNLSALEQEAKRKSEELDTMKSLLDEKDEKLNEAASKLKLLEAKLKLLEAHAVRADGMNPGESQVLRRRRSSSSVALEAVEEKKTPEDLEAQLTEKTRAIDKLEEESKVSASALAAALSARKEALERVVALESKVRLLEEPAASQKTPSPKLVRRLSFEDKALQKVRFPLGSRFSEEKSRMYAPPSKGAMARARRMSPHQIVVDEMDLLRRAADNPSFKDDEEEEAPIIEPSEEDLAAARLQAAHRGRVARQQTKTLSLPPHLAHDDALSKRRASAATAIESGFRGFISRRRSSIPTIHEHQAHDAALTLQKRARGHSTRKHLDLLLPPQQTTHNDDKAITLEKEEDDTSCRPQNNKEEEEEPPTGDSSSS